MRTDDGRARIIGRLRLTLAILGPVSAIALLLLREAGFSVPKWWLAVAWLGFPFVALVMAYPAMRARRR